LTPRSPGTKITSEGSDVIEHIAEMIHLT